VRICGWLGLCGVVVLLCCPAASLSSVSKAPNVCTAAQKAKRQVALRTYRKHMLAARKRFFKTHRGHKQRARFVRAQQAKLKALRHAAACIVRNPLPGKPPTPPDTRPPTLVGAGVNGPVLTLSFDESLAADNPGTSSFAVTVNGLAWTVDRVQVAGTAATLTLRPAIEAGQSVHVSYVPPSAGQLRDVAGNAMPSFAADAANSSPAGPAPSLGSFSPSLAKPSFADDHSSIEPWVGEWGPKTDPQWVGSTGHLHALLVPVDFPDAPATDPPAFYRDLFTATTPHWYAESSYGRLSFDIASLDHYVRMSNPIDSYNLLNCCPSASIHAFFQELISKIDPEVDFSQVDSVYAIAPAAAGPHMTILLWRRWPGSGIVADGHEVLNGVVGNGNYNPATAYYLAHYAMTHETGHMMGLADLYGRACPTCVDTHDWVGVWSMMDTADAPSAEFLGWDKWLLRWLDATQIRGVTSSEQSLEEVVSPLEEPGGVKLVVVPMSSTFLYAVEVRQPIGQDVRLCDHGVLVYTVDSTKMNGSGPTRIQPAHLGGSCGPISAAAYDLGPGEVSTFEDANVKVELLTAYPDGSYRVRVTHK